ncbi:hypothetical protein, partial [Vibrio bathopelagicus]
MKKEFIKNNSIAFISHVLIYMKGIFLMPIIIKTVGVSVYGGLALITSFVAILSGISSMGVGAKSFRYLPSSKTANEKAFNFYPAFYFKIFSLVIISALLILFENHIMKHFAKSEITFSLYIIPI